ncbi:MAG TPA: MBL fold metallo-hydrolase [Gemmatimonadaceae bacterium]|nr:MBL fold metallo-hydrolase [Gemmatimonadaceae bacterium]
MFFSRIYDGKLAQASYLIGCQTTGDALIIDPNRDIAQYLRAAAAERLRITHVTETHIHADFMSGARELAEKTGAKLLLSSEGGPDWQYAFAKSSNATMLRNGDSFMLGRVRFDVMHTPGHTPEHLMFVLTDLPSGPHPVIAFTGDFVFVGDVGRPDLLEKAAKVANTMEAGARDLWRSIERFRALADHVQVWPGHGAGSACGKALGAVPSSTVGYEKLVNWGVSAPSEDVFVRGVLEGQPEPPAYFARMKRLNRDGPPAIGELPAPHAMSADDFARHRNDGTVFVDLRKAKDFARAHVPGSINVPLTRSFTTYAGSVVPYDQPIAFIAQDDAGVGVAEAARDLALIGFAPSGAFAPPSIVARATDLASAPALEPAAVVARLNAKVQLVDVRNSAERAEAHIPGSQHIPFPDVIARAAEFPRNEPVLVHCQTGARSAVAVSALRRAGVDAIDAGGIVQLARAGLRTAS